MDNRISGSCYCGKVRFALKNAPKLVVNCHCDDCKRRNGAAFSSYVAVTEDDLEISAAENVLNKYKIKDLGIKYFCSECGTPIYNRNFRLPGLSLLFYGVFTNAAELKPSVNVFCSTKLDWVDTISDIKSFQQAIER